MRALSACLTVVLGLGVAVIAACSSTASDSAAGGTAGTATSGGSGGTATGGTSSGGKGGTAAAGTSSSAAGADNGGAPACTFNSDACQTCLMGHCGTQETACTDDTAMCGSAIFALDGCLCGGTMSVAECETTFITDGGAKAKTLADCFDANCKTACE